MLECLEARDNELMARLEALTARRPRRATGLDRAAIDQQRRELRGRLSVYTPALARITTTDAAREYLEKASSEAWQLLDALRRPDETINEVEAAAPIPSGFYHETRYALALLAVSPDGQNVDALNVQQDDATPRRKETRQNDS